MVEDFISKSKINSRANEIEITFEELGHEHNKLYKLKIRNL